MQPFAPPYGRLVLLISWSRLNYPKSGINCALEHDRTRQAGSGKLRDMAAPRTRMECSKCEAAMLRFQIRHGGVHRRCAESGHRQARVSFDEGPMRSVGPLPQRKTDAGRSGDARSPP
jgi:hypothetical protein